MERLKEKLLKFMNQYADEYVASKTKGYKSSLGNLVRNEIPGILTKNLDTEIYSVEGSIGKGRWTNVPWVAVFDIRITTSVQRGVYIVYLLNKDTKTLYLTLNQGATAVLQEGDTNAAEKTSFTGVASSTNKKTISTLKERAETIRKMLGTQDKYQFDAINTGSKAYDAGCIYSKVYKVDELPDDDELIADLDGLIKVYREYYLKQYGENKDVLGLQINHTDLEEGEMDCSIKDKVNQIKQYISSNGFTYRDGLVENFYLSLKSKPFVILAGISGTGKTKLVSLFAEAIGAKTKLVPVRPDWSDSSDLFGHVDLSGKFVPGEIIDFVKEASDNFNTPYILCLDEMNLARVEYYLSDFLSIIETRRFADGEIVTDPLLAKEKYGVGNGAYEFYGDLYLPENLYIVGTVNMDETTFPFSKKVLDRANTIEFSYVDLMPDFTGYGESADSLALDNSFLKTEYLKLAECAEEATFIEEICSELQDTNKVLQAADAHVGYRVRDEIVFYMLNNKKAELLDRDAAMDNEIMQKILPRIQGSSSAVKEMLCELFKIFCSDYRDHQTAGSDLFEQMQKALDAGAKYPESAKKVAFMVRRFDEDGFTSYWL